MDTTEQNIRKYLKTFTYEDIVNSIYLFGVDFDTASIDDIMQSLCSLYKEVSDLKVMVDRNFEPLDGERLPKDPRVQAVIIQDYDIKKTVLLKALSNTDIYNALKSYRMAESQKATGPTIKY